MKEENSKDVPGAGLWTNGLICAFEFVHGHHKSTVQVNSESIVPQVPNDILDCTDYGNTLPQSSAIFGSDMDVLENHLNNHGSYAGRGQPKRRVHGSYWKPIGWCRISELLLTVRVEEDCNLNPFHLSEDDVAVADIATPYWLKPVGPTWWCHVAAGHPYVTAWLTNAQWLHPAISVALRDESKLISERLKFLLYEVSVRVAGGLLFELLGQSPGDPYTEEDDVPVVLRCCGSFGTFLFRRMSTYKRLVVYVQLSFTSLNCCQELLAGGGTNLPKNAHEVIALLACRLARWDDRRTQEDMHLFHVIMNQEIRRLSAQVIRVKWCLHAREEIVFELLQHMKGNAARNVLDMIRKSTRQMIEEQEAVRGRLFTIQDVMQSTVRSWLQDKSLRVTHNLGVFGGCGLILSIITGLFGINVDGIPGAENTPYAFALFSGILMLLGVLLIGVGLIYLGLKKPIMEKDVEVRKMELQELVRMFEHEAESHAQVRKPVPRTNLSPTAADLLPNSADYVLINQGGL